MKFSTFHSFMLVDAIRGGKLPDDVDAGILPQHYDQVVSTHHNEIQMELEEIRWVEELGFDGVWLREHHFTDYGFLPNTMVMLGYIASMTKRIRLGSAVVTLPLHNPVRAAEDAALVDVISNGRLNYGIGRGYQSIEFDTLGVPMDDSRERCSEEIESIIQLWSNDTASYHGRFVDFEQVRLQPKPLQQPHPPVFYASISKESVLHFAKLGIPFIVDSTLTLSSLDQLCAAWSEVASAHGHDPGSGELVAMRTVWLDETDERAREYVGRAPKVESTAHDPKLAPRKKDGSIARGYEYWQRGWHGRSLKHYDTSENWENRWIAGDIDRVVGGIERLEEMGVKNLIVGFGSDPEPTSRAEKRRRMELFAREVMPHFR